MGLQVLRHPSGALLRWTTASYFSLTILGSALWWHVPPAVAQGTVQFNNRVDGQVVTHVYLAPSYTQFVGDGSNDYPPGTVQWTGFTPLSGSEFSAALLSAPGAGAAQSSLVFASAPTSFRTGSGAGFVVATTATLANVPADAPAATLEMFAWENHGGRFADPQEARSYAWPAGLSGTFTVVNLGGAVNTPPALTGLQSFCLPTGIIPGQVCSAEIFTPPRSQVALVGTPVTFSVAAMNRCGSLPLAYQWLFQGTNIADAHASTFTVPNVQLADSGAYSVRVCAIQGDAVSPAATLTVLEHQPPVTNLATLPGGGLRLDGTCAPGLVYVLEVASDLAPPVAWSPLATNLPGSDCAFHFTDTQTAGCTRRFYRVAVSAPGP